MRSQNTILSVQWKSYLPCHSIRLFSFLALVLLGLIPFINEIDYLYAFSHISSGHNKSKCFVWDKAMFSPGEQLSCQTKWTYDVPHHSPLNPHADHRFPDIFSLISFHLFLAKLKTVFVKLLYSMVKDKHSGTSALVIIIYLHAKSRAFITPDGGG